MPPAPLHLSVATVLTACGIETSRLIASIGIVLVVATVLTACGIETVTVDDTWDDEYWVVATVLTACGIETCNKGVLYDCTHAFWLQQCLPLAVLKPHFARLKLLGSLRCNSAYRLRY